jgi:hypothetical protein
MSKELFVMMLHDFDHDNRMLKENKNPTYDRAEALKCAVRCAPCHKFKSMLSGDLNSFWVPLNVDGNQVNPVSEREVEANVGEDANKYTGE